MKNILKLVAQAALAAFFFAGSAFSQTSGTVTNHAFAIGKGPGVTGFASLLCATTQIPVGQTSADPICRTVTGDVTINASGVTAIGATKVTSAMLNADVYSTAHTWAGQQTFVAPILGAATGTSLAIGGASLSGNALAVSGEVGISGTAKVQNAIAIPAGGIAGTGYLFSTTASFGTTFGSGAPTLPAAQGSLYLRSDGAPYYNTNGSTGWTSLATPAIANVTGLGTGVATALGTSVGSAGAFVTFNGALGTPSSGTLTNATGLPVGGVTGLGTGVATFLATPSSANLRAALTDETGTGIAYFVGGALGTPASGVATNLTGTASGLTAGNVTTNANLTGPITSVGNATSIAAQTGTGTTFMMQAAPTFTTSITGPLYIGGTAVGSTATIQSTSGAGTTDAISLATGSQVERLRVMGGTASGVVGVGTNLSGISGARFIVNQNTANVAVPTVGGTMPLVAMIHADNAIGGFSGMTFGANGPQYNMQMAGGTGASPAATASGTSGAYVWQGYANGTYRSGALIFGTASELWTNTANGMHVSVYTTPNGTTSIAEAARFQPSGGLSVGTTADPGIGTMILKKQAFSALTACSSTIEGTMASITDSSTAVWGATITGGSTNHVMGYCNGTNWTVAAK